MLILSLGISSQEISDVSDTEAASEGMAASGSDASLEQELGERDVAGNGPNGA